MKKLNFVLAFGIIGIAALTFSCSSGSEQKASKTETVVQNETEADEIIAEEANEMAAQMARGEQIYLEKCIACHQMNGLGIANVFPNLVGNNFLLNQKTLAVSQVLNGSENVAAEKNIKYPAPMPPQADTKEDAIAVINYVLNNFGNNGGYVMLDDVKDIEILPRP